MSSNTIDTSRFWGVKFYKKLTFIPHVLNLIKKMWQNTRYFKSLMKHDLRCRSHFYDQNLQVSNLLEIRLCLPSVWLNMYHYLKKLDTVHPMALRICSWAFRTSPGESLDTDCVEPSLTLIIVFYLIHIILFILIYLAQNMTLFT